MAAPMEGAKPPGALGPRIIGRLTPELILRSPQYMNPVNQYEIDLRANRIAAIENLGATEVRAGQATAGGAVGRERRVPRLSCCTFLPCCRTSLTA